MLKAMLMLWWCPQCDIYFQRTRSWTMSAAHENRWRVGSAVASLNVDYNGKYRCGGIASPLRDGPILAAYIVGGLQAVYDMNKKVN